MRETVGSLQISMTGTGSFSTARRAGSMTMQMTVPGAAATAIGSSLRLRLVFAGDTFYIKLPPAMSAKIPGGKPWLELDFGTLSRMAGIPGMSSSMAGSSSMYDPGQFLDYLRAASAGSIQDRGLVTVDGIETTHYSGDIELAKVPDALPASARKGAEQLVGALQKEFRAGKMPVDAWIDARHLVRRIAMSYKLRLPGTGKSTSVSMLLDFVAYGPQPRPAIPPASQTTNLDSLIHVSF